MQGAACNRHGGFATVSLPARFRSHRAVLGDTPETTSTASMSLRAVAAVAAGLTVGAAAVAVRRRPVKYVLHVYDHCPFCNRVEWLMQRHGLPYRREVYGYGAGARPEKCDGHGYGEGPLHLTGKKMLPVLEGPGVPVAAG